VLAGAQRLGADELLAGDAQEVIDVKGLSVLDEERVPAESRLQSETPCASGEWSSTSASML
jgi:hypothetical protein